MGLYIPFLWGDLVVITGISGHSCGVYSHGYIMVVSYTQYTYKDDGLMDCSHKMLRMALSHETVP